MRVFLLCVLILVSMCAIGCDSNDEVDAESLVGTWNATRFEFTNAARTTEKVDLVSAGGSFTMIVSESLSYQATLQIPGVAPEVTTGQLTASTDVLTVSEDGVGFDLQFDMTLSANTLTLTGANSEYDFDDDGTDDPAILNITFSRIDR